MLDWLRDLIREGPIFWVLFAYFIGYAHGENVMQRAYHAWRARRDDEDRV